MQIREALQDYYGSITLLRPKVQAGYKQRLDVFCAWCESQGITLEHINANVVNTFVAHLKATHVSHKAGKPELSTFTLAGYVRNIQQWLNWCLYEEAYDAVVKPRIVKRIKRPKVDKHLIETFTQSQLQGLLDACQEEFTVQLRDRNRTIVMLLLDTGIRASELCGLTVGNVHLDPNDAFIRVFGKGQKEREIGPLGELARKELAHYLKVYRKGAAHTDLVFLNRFREPLTVWGLDDMIATLGRRAGIEGVRCSPHTLRHQFAVSHLLANGNLLKLSLLMGHENISTTQIYLRTVTARMARNGKSVLDGLKVQ